MKICLCKNTGYIIKVGKRWGKEIKVLILCPRCKGTSRINNKPESDLGTTLDIPEITSFEIIEQEKQDDS